jgi:hypothetical protein
MEWRHVNSPSKKKFKTLPSAGKVMCTVFWDRKGVILLDFPEPGQTINSDRHIAILTKLKARISIARPEKKTIFLLQHDNALEDRGVHRQSLLDCRITPTVKSGFGTF